MKEFRKTPEGLFICEECGKICKTINGLSHHIKNQHKYLSHKDYYDKWLKDKNEEICLICGNIQQDIPRWDRGYKKTCSKKCENILSYKTRKQINSEKYGVECNWQREDVKEKCKQTCFKNHNVEYSLQSKEIRNKGKQTCKEKYGDENYNNREKSKQTCLENYGGENVFQNEEIKEKIEQTCLEKYKVKKYVQSNEFKEKRKETYRKKYGVEHNMQDKNLFEKNQKSGFKIKLYKDLWYQGSFELDFLEKYYSIYLDIQRGPSVKYIFEGKQKVYHPDFYISSLNLVVEIKALYYYNKFKDQCEAKKKATISNGFNYIMIIEKDYNVFNAFSSE